jgi:hypothetical protein
MMLMQPGGELTGDLTTEHIKSHLQKFRQVSRETRV